MVSNWKKKYVNITLKKTEIKKYIPHTRHGERGLNLTVAVNYTKKISCPVESLVWKSAAIYIMHNLKGIISNTYIYIGHVSFKYY